MWQRNPVKILSCHFVGGIRSFSHVLHTYGAAPRRCLAEDVSASSPIPAFPVAWKDETVYWNLWQDRNNDNDLI